MEIYLGGGLPFDVVLIHCFGMHLHYLILDTHRDVALYVTLRARRQILRVCQHGPLTIVLTICVQKQ